MARLEMDRPRGADSPFQLERYRSQLQALHDHICPRQVLGLRMGELAGSLLGVALPQADKRLFAFVETDGCFADGVMVATGCSLGHRTLRLMDFGKVAAAFVDTSAEPERAVRIWPHPLARVRASDYAAGAQSRWHLQLAAYQAMPADLLLCAQPIRLSVSMQALISRPGVRVLCASCGEEIINEREVARDGRLVCRSCAGDAYCHPAPELAPLAQQAVRAGRFTEGAGRLHE
jgi:formylmethanofuran dehydrogenase subunit E